MRVLITGAAGRLGRRLSRTLETEHDLILSDIQPLDDPRFVQLDVTDLNAVRTSMQSCEAVVHMAMMDWAPCGARESLRHAAPCLRVHVIGLQNVLHVALETGVRRVVYTSSVSVIDSLPPDTFVGPDTRPYSNAIYGLTKGFGEDLCRMFFHAFGLSVAVLRLGTIFAPEAGGAWIGNVFHPDLTACPPPATASSRVHVDDVTRAIELALEAPDLEYALAHVVGADSGQRWDLETARSAFGWEPRYAFGAHGLA